MLTRHAHRQASLRLSAEVREVNPYDLNALGDALHGCDCVVNLAGILNTSARYDFREVHIRNTLGMVSCP